MALFEKAGHTSTLGVSVKVFPERLRFESEDGAKMASSTWMSNV